MRGVVGSGLVVVALLRSPVAAEPDVRGGRPALLVGGGLGLSGLGDVPDPLLEAHAGGGWRGSAWMVAGLAAYTYTQSEPILGSWSIARHDLEAICVVALRPMSSSKFRLHGQLGVGAAFDQLSGVDPHASTRGLSASVGAGAGWGPAALTFRYAIPDPNVCSDESRCFHAATGAQVLLSATFDLASFIR